MEGGSCVQGGTLHVAHSVSKGTALPPGQPADGGAATDITGTQTAAGSHPPRAVRGRHEGSGRQWICHPHLPGGSEQGRRASLVPAPPPGHQPEQGEAAHSLRLCCGASRNLPQRPGTAVTGPDEQAGGGAATVQTAPSGRHGRRGGHVPSSTGNSTGPGRAALPVVARGTPRGESSRVQDDCTPIRGDLVPQLLRVRPA